MRQTARCFPRSCSTNWSELRPRKPSAAGLFALADFGRPCWPLALSSPQAMRRGESLFAFHGAGGATPPPLGDVTFVTAGSPL